MRHQVRKSKLNKPRDHARIMLKNLATSLIMHEKIKTTEAKAKILRSLMDKIINDAKGKDKPAAIRKVQSVIQTELAQKKLMEEITKRYQDKNSGYTRSIKLGFRAGDAAPLVQIELT